MASAGTRSRPAEDRHERAATPARAGLLRDIESQRARRFGQHLSTSRAQP